MSEKPDQVLTNNDIDARLEKIRERISSVQSGTAENREGDYLTPEDAALDVETLINATYGDSTLFSESTISSATLQLPLNSLGKVTITDFVAIYNASTCHLKSHFNNTNTNFRHVFLIDTRIDSIANNVAYMGITTVIGIKPAPINEVAPTCGDVYAVNDVWEHGFGHGKCGGFEDPQFSGKDAGTRITEMLNTHVLNPLPKGFKYFYNVKYSAYYPLSGIKIEGSWQYGPEVFLTPNDITLNDNIRDKIVFYNKHGNPNYPMTCINKLDMEWYTCNWSEIFKMYKPVGKTFAYCKIRGEGIDDGSGHIDWLHNGEGFFGQTYSVSVTDPPLNPSDITCE
jgi:hypothetical protein